MHDSLVIDQHPSENIHVNKILQWAMKEIYKEVKERFDYDLTIPLDIEMAVGKNWMEIIETPLDSDT